jgi:type IV secretory pathway VirB3-like protein
MTVVPVFHFMQRTAPPRNPQAVDVKTVSRSRSSSATTFSWYTTASFNKSRIEMTVIGLPLSITGR